tara:strand:+ start:1202 stop:1447 length:246 start_codon:yes stop_codon:yes gene_type:complete
MPTGVRPAKKKFRADIRINGVNTYLGLFFTEEEAAEAYKNKKIERDKNKVYKTDEEKRAYQRNFMRIRKEREFLKILNKSK